jgi:hypothetical protein
LAALELAVDRRRIDFETGGKTVDDGQQHFAVRFTGGQQAEHKQAILVNFLCETALFPGFHGNKKGWGRKPCALARRGKLDSGCLHDCESQSWGSLASGLPLRAPHVQVRS